MESGPGLHSIALEAVEPKALQILELRTTSSEDDLSKESPVLTETSPSVGSSKGGWWVFNAGRIRKAVSVSSARDCSHWEISWFKSLFQGYSAPFVHSLCSCTFTRIERFCKYWCFLPAECEMLFGSALLLIVWLALDMEGKMPEFFYLGLILGFKCSWTASFTLPPPASVDWPCLFWNPEKFPFFFLWSAINRRGRRKKKN